MARFQHNTCFQVLFLLTCVAFSNAAHRHHVRPCILSSQTCEDQENRTEIYHQKSIYSATQYMCCLPGRHAKHEEDTAASCHASHCVALAHSGGDLCDNIGTRTVAKTGEVMTFVEAVRDSCNMPNGDQGVEALCCGSNTTELMLTTLLGVELQEFPHFARLEVDNGHITNICGGTIYNERHIITASHCVVDKANFQSLPFSKFKVVLDVLISGKRTDNEYKVANVSIHPNASLLIKDNIHHPLNFDIAVIKLDRDIQFSDKIQALPLAKKKFNPKDYADTAIIVGFGDTDTLTTSKKLQKGDAYIRDTNKTIEELHRYHGHRGDKKQLIMLGGFENGIPSISGSGGDSGGPAVCRDKDGYAVLCGLTSFGPNNKAQCEKFRDEAHCFPTAYVKIDYFRDWIEKVAKDQSKARVMKQPLYGKDVAFDKYPHQVRITSGNDKDSLCGGTLIAKDIVLTAAHCVAQSNGQMKRGLRVSREVKEHRYKKEEVKSIKVMEGWAASKGKNNTRPRRIAYFGTKVTWEDPYYRNDLALVKLTKPVNISTKALPKLAEEEAAPGKATEVAWMTDHRRHGNLSERGFNLMTKTECQKRMGRLSHAGYDIKVDENVVCGVEEYSGGSKCDRTTGGGVFCGGNVLCGVQAFRICEFAVPSAFVDVGKEEVLGWIEENMESL